MRVIQATELLAADASADVASTGFDSSSVAALSVQATATGTIAGTLKVQFSNDPVLAVEQVTHWSDVPNKSVSVSGAGTVIIDRFDCCYSFMRLFYDATSGAGGIQANIKTIGF